MHPHEYSALDAVALRDLIASGELTAAETQAAARAAIASVNPELNALAAPLFEDALECDDGASFRGVPTLLKDSGPMARHVGFSLGSRAIAGAVASADHPFMTGLRASGLAAIGVTTAPELSLSFATESLLNGVTRNPWALDRGVGGSSGGAAALVAAGAIPIAHASDGAGSIRVPASACGVVGLKPGRGTTPAPARASTIGADAVVEFALTRTVRDAAALFDAIAIGQPAPATLESLDADPGRLRIGLATRAWDSGTMVDPQVAAATESVARTLEWIGHRVDDVRPELDAQQLSDASLLSFYAAGQALLRVPRQPDPALLEAVSRRLLDETRAVTAVELTAGARAETELTRTVDAFFEHVDLLVTPTLALLPAPHGTLDYNDGDHDIRSWMHAMFEYGPFTAAFNLTGHPAISLPLGESATGLPIGVQLIAARGGERLLLQVAAQLEQAMPWAARQPSIYADSMTS